MIGTATIPSPVRVFRRLTGDLVIGTLFFWAIYTAVVAAFGGIFALITGPLESSAWNEMLWAPRIYALAIGYHMVAVYLPLYLAHGVTRREYVLQSMGAIGLLTAVLGVLLAAGYAGEAVLFGLLGWGHAIPSAGLFESAFDLHIAAPQLALLMLPLVLAGAIVGAAMYRELRLVFLMVPAAGVLAIPGHAVVGQLPFGPITLPFGLDPSIPLLIAATVVSAAGLVTLLWSMIHDIPLKNQ